MFGKLLDTVVDAALQPVRDGISIIEGLSEGEIREKAILRLGADVVAGMAFAEIVEYVKTLDE